MRILLTKISDERHVLEIVRADGDREGIELVSRELLFHDFLHYAVESALGTDDGFWGALSRGKRFKDLDDRTGAAMGGLAMPIAGIEAIVGMLTGVVKSKEPTDRLVTTVRGYMESLGVSTPVWCTPAFIDDVRERMRRIVGRWKAVPYRGTMEIGWPCDALRPARSG